MQSVNGIVEFITDLNDFLNGIVWGAPVLLLIIAAGVYFTVRTGFFQVRRAGIVSRNTFLAIFRGKSATKSRDKKAISQFGAVSTALAATIGTGNIVGVATALAIGGPGSIFWMWVSAFFGMMTNYAENVLGIYYRKRNRQGEWSGGAMYYLENGFCGPRTKKIGKILAVLFALFCVLASFGIGNMTQVNSISSAMWDSFGIPPLYTGVAVALVAGLVILGGIKRISSVTEKLVPFMALFYMAGTIFIFVMNYRQIPYVFSSIFKNAFGFTAAAGGISGALVKKAVSLGFKRGVFSNEAGLGSTVIVNSTADVREPAVQGMWGIFQVFFDTIVVCTLTAFVLLSSTSAAAAPMSQVLANVTEQPQYFTISSEADGDHLIDDSTNSAIVPAKSGDSDTVTLTAYFKGEPYEVEVLAPSALSDDQKTYTNIMSVRAQQRLTDAGEAVMDDNGRPVYDIIFEEVNGVPLVSFAFSEHFGIYAGKILSVAVLLFAFATVLGWSFYGTKSVEYLFGHKAVLIYKIIFIAFIVIGATINLELAWDISDTLNGFMAIPNLIGVLALSPVVIKITKDFINRNVKKQNCEPMLSKYSDIQAAQYEALLLEQQEKLQSKKAGKK